MKVELRRIYAGANGLAGQIGEVLNLPEDEALHLIEIQAAYAVPEAPVVESEPESDSNEGEDSDESEDEA